MSVPRPLVVLDTNTLVRAASRSTSPAGRLIEGCLQREFILLLSKPVLAEYRKVLGYEKVLARNPEITGKRLVLLLQRLRFFSEYLPTISVTFEFDRDPDDAKFVELAIAGNATHIVTYDRDLLSLRDQHTDAAKRFRQRLPNAKILAPPELLALLRVER